MLEVHPAFSLGQKDSVWRYPQGITADFCATMTWTNIKMDHSFCTWAEELEWKKQGVDKKYVSAKNSG